MSFLSCLFSLSSFLASSFTFFLSPILSIPVFLTPPSFYLYSLHVCPVHIVFMGLYLKWSLSSLNHCVSKVVCIEIIIVHLIHRYIYTSISLSVAVLCGMEHVASFKLNFCAAFLFFFVVLGFFLRFFVSFSVLVGWLVGFWLVGCWLVGWLLLYFLIVTSCSWENKCTF